MVVEAGETVTSISPATFCSTFWLCSVESRAVMCAVLNSASSLAMMSR